MRNYFYNFCKFFYKNFIHLFQWLISYGESKEILNNLDGENYNFMLTSDCDHAQYKRHKKILKDLGKEGIKVTIAVFVCLEKDDSLLSAHCSEKDTVSLADKDFLNLIISTCLNYGHEIAYHGYSQISNKRDDFLFGLEEFKRLIGFYPEIYIEHGGKYGFHNPSLCKRETLLYEGSNLKSDYYIKDILQRRFKAVWAEHDYVEDFKDISIDDIFYLKDEITRFKRKKASKIKHPLISRKNNSSQKWELPYTHFNYDGFPLSAENILERWDFWGYNRSIKYLKYLKDSNTNFYTVSESLNLWNNAKKLK